MIQAVSAISVVLLLTVVACGLPTSKARQILFLAASYVFYAYWGLGFLFILIISSLLNYAYGLVLRRKPTALRLWIGIALNVLPLAFFKYLPALLGMESVDSWQYELGRQIVLPVGMSYWTFQGLSYLFDVYYEEELDPSLMEFCLYMAFWPTVLSGPICRLPAMLPQFRQLSPCSWEDFSAGGLRLIQGVVMKFVLAQILAGWVATGFDQMGSGWGGLDVWLLGIGFGFLLFFDFAGYSHMVIGAARIFGIRVAENFNRPFLSTTPSMFWTRWHMSLSFWIRDYLFNPLAAAGRRFRWWPYLVLIISMTAFGLWHGPHWTFVVYGVYHGVVLVMHRLAQQIKRRLPARVPPGLGAFSSWGTTFALVGIGFVLFRSNSLGQAWNMLGAVVTPAAYGRLAMPRGFYLVTFGVVLGYFLVVGSQSMLLSWRKQFRDAMGESIKTAGPTPASIALNNFILGVGGLLDFLTAKLWWWLAPALSILVFWASLVLHTKDAAIAVTPFIYTLF